MRINYAAIVVAAGWMFCGPINAEPVPVVPDLINGGSPDAKHDWTLGPTGARGWIWGWRGQTTTRPSDPHHRSRAGSPADGVLRKNDVLLGVNMRLSTTMRVSRWPRPSPKRRRRQAPRANTPCATGRRRTCGSPFP